MAKYCKNKNENHGEASKTGHFPKKQETIKRKTCVKYARKIITMRMTYFRMKTDLKNKKILFLTMNCKYNEDKNVQFIVDSDCTSHMSNNKLLFEKIDEKGERMVAKNNESMEALGIVNIDEGRCILKVHTRPIICECNNTKKK